MSTTGRSGFGATFSGSALGSIGELRSVPPPNISVANDIEFGSMESTDGYIEYKAGMIEPGELALEIIYDADRYDALIDAIGDDDTFTITWADTSTFVFSGYLKGLSAEVPYGDKMMITATFKVSGKPTFTAAT